MRERKKILKSLSMDKSLSFFLDRDGVINKKIDGGYVRNWNDLNFYLTLWMR
ncbi:MAG: hypothetical protein KatS3mg068_2334 [Candidatus Sericytochromatia bacterium]|nr:MAG: hypothetical protein KatS3mg068_2334 [Candidatus Sericytochromatia bacterium]